MNYKLLLPTYRTRFRFVGDALGRWSQPGGFAKGLHMGCGEGDYDPMIAAHCTRLESIDANGGDVAFAKQQGSHLENLHYSTGDVQELEYADGAFDLVVTVDVLEHVDSPEKMMDELARVLAPGGLAVVTFPQTRFPLTYDPINRIFGPRTVRLGAYGFGHESLIDPNLFEGWVKERGLEVLASKNLSGHLVGWSEMYWPSLLQRGLKANAGNAAESAGDDSPKKARPSHREPRLVALTDAWIGLDRLLFSKWSRSVGRGYVLRKWTD